MVLAGVAAHNIYEECLISKSILYIGHKGGFIVDILDLGDFGKGCLEKKTDATRGDEMRFDGWLFLIISWGVIFGLTIFCFIKIFSKKELK